MAVGTESIVQVPDTYSGLPVTKIGTRAFSGNQSVEEIILPKSLTDIGREAFSNCRNLRKVSLPENIEKLGRRAFAFCSSLVDISVPDRVRVLESGTFHGCTALKKVELPYGLEVISDSSFIDCTSLQTLYYFSKTGISATMRTNYDLVEKTLPVFLKRIEKSAFQNCSALETISIPYQVTRIESRTFQGCSSLRAVELHDDLEKIDPNSFHGCHSLETIRIPSGCRSIGRAAFQSSTTLVVAPESIASKQIQKQKLFQRPILEMPANLTSEMKPIGSALEYKASFTEQIIQSAEEQYEIRRPSFELFDREQRPNYQLSSPSRFGKRNGGYIRDASVEGIARIMMVGDIMARARQQNAAMTSTEGFKFDFTLSRLGKVLQQGDVVIGNLESTVSPSAPYSSERQHINARPHLNAPEEFLSSLKNNGFDVLVNAQNHIYDSGTRGVFETLEMMNKNQLMHTGTYVSPDDQRFLLMTIGDISVAVVGYLDVARQKMKRANFTRTGRRVMFPVFDQKQISEDINAAKQAGAEFVIAYAHWGREYTTEITVRQRKYAQMLADSGVDYIFGAHSHCIQPFEFLQAKNGKSVPCLFSGGNFISDMNINAPITRDTVIMDLQLQRNEEGQVEILSHSYHPCRIMYLKDGTKKNYIVVPADQGKTQAQKKALAEASDRISKVIGNEVQIHSQYL